MDRTLTLRPATSADGPAMRELARATQALSVNSTYYYALMARHFHKTCIIAEDQGRPCGYVTGYMVPERPSTLFIWQVGVSPTHQGQGLGKKMLLELIGSVQPASIEATIAPANQASLALFRSVARQLKTEHRYGDAPFFGQEDLGAGDEAEHLMHIGPINTK